MYLSSVGTHAIQMPAEPVFTRHPKKRNVGVLYKRFAVVVNGKNHYVPKGYNFKRSGPELWMGEIPTLGPITPPIIFHDWCYDNELYGRKECDDIMNSFMYMLDIPDFQRRRIYFGVRTGGYFLFKDHSWEWLRS